MGGSVKDAVGVYILAGGVLVALFSPQLSVQLAPYAMQALFVVICCSLFSFANHSFRDLVTLEKKTWLMVAWQQAALPAIVLAIGILAELPVNIVSLMIVTACAGSLFASPMLAGLLSLEYRRALQTMVLSTFTMPVSLYVFLGLLNDAHVPLNFDVYIMRAAIFLIIPFAILWVFSVVLRYVPKVVSQSVIELSRWTSIVALLIFGVGIMQPVSVELYEHPMKVAAYLGLVVTMSVSMLVLTVIVMYRFGLNEAMTASVQSGLRNVGLSLALIGDMIGSELALYVGLSMLPVFLAPAIIHVMTTQNRTVLSTAV